MPSFARPDAPTAKVGEHWGSASGNPKFHEYFRKWKPPLFAIWGRFDPYFIPAGAEAFRRDIPGATVQFLDTGHFALETHVEEIAVAIDQSENTESDHPDGKGGQCRLLASRHRR